MESEKEKMISGKLYNAVDKELLTERANVKEQIYIYNSLPPGEDTKRSEVLANLLGKTGKTFFAEPPFRCDYGYNIEIGENFYSNYNLVILDCAKVTIGSNVLIGPNVGIFTAGHPLHHKDRDRGFEFALPVKIGNSVWIGGNVIINPGVTVGDNSVIGSGSVVTKNIPANVVAAGNPCRVLREITDDDKM